MGMRNHKFKPGDIVRLKSGSPRMTVNEIHEDGKLGCIWFDISDLKEKSVAPHLLEKVYWWD